jgi:hypothetical protein
VQKGLIGPIFVGGVECNLRSRRSNRALRVGSKWASMMICRVRNPGRKCVGERDNRRNKGNGRQ